MEPEQISTFFALARPFLNERARRLLAASLAREIGIGGCTLVSAATGIARSTITRGLAELEGLPADDPCQQGSPIRDEGGGRKKADFTQPELADALEQLVDPVTRGDPESPLRWVAKSLRSLAAALREMGFKVSHETVRQLLKRQGYSLQANSKTLEGTQHPDRNAQFEFIAAQASKFMDADQPVISVDTKKKELVGEYLNGGREWQPKGKPVEVNTHDFPEPGKGKAVPYGIYDIGEDEGWVSVGMSSDTAEFAVEAIRRWWLEMGRLRYPNARHLMVTADGGGSNSSRGRLWKLCLQRLSDELGLRIWVCHYPPGTSKWNKIEHRMFSRITQNWRGRPLTSLEVIISLIANTRLGGGTKIRVGADTSVYEKGKRVTQSELDQVRLLLQEFHSEWNYVIIPTAECPNWPDVT